MRLAAFVAISVTIHQISWGVWGFSGPSLSQCQSPTLLAEREDGSRRRFLNSSCVSTLSFLGFSSVISPNDAVASGGATAGKYT